MKVLKVLCPQRQFIVPRSELLLDGSTTLPNKACKIATVSMLSTVSMLQIATLLNKECKIRTVSMLSTVSML